MERPKRNATKLPDPDFISDFVEIQTRVKFEKRSSSEEFESVIKSPRLEKNGISPSKIKSPRGSKTNPPKVDATSSPGVMQIKIEEGIEPPKTTEERAKSPKVRKKTPKKKSRDKASGITPVGMPLMRTKYQRSNSGGNLGFSIIDGRKRKTCEKSGCKSVLPVCAVGISDSCDGGRFTARWYHISRGEHYCNNCFEYVYRRSGVREFSLWKRAWIVNGKSEASIRVFMADQCLPFWISCSLCGKWRQMSSKTNASPDFIRKFRCGMNSQGTLLDGNNCEVQQDERVAEVSNPEWLTNQQTGLYLQHSPAAGFLTRYYPDKVGMSAFTHVRKAQNGKVHNSESEDSDFEDDDLLMDSKTALSLAEDPEVEGSNPFIQPFDQPHLNERALCCKPDAMSAEEEKAFPQHARKHSHYVLYLALRNLILAMWSLNCKEWLTADKCIPHLICRGLLRIKCVLELPPILRFLTIKGYINTGFVQKPQDLLLLPKKPELKVLVVGGGAAGIAAAHYLQRAGIEVTVLEAQGRLGGRVDDGYDLGLCVGRGAQIIGGCINNPIALLCHQLDMPLRPITEKCDLIDEKGKIINQQVDSRIDFHFNAMLDNIAEWRKDKTVSLDVNLFEKIQDMHKQFLEESQLNFSEEELRLLQFHISNLEYACGANLEELSAIYWDQNEAFPQFAGNHMLISGGYAEVIKKLAENINIHYNAEVVAIDYSGERICVTTKSGETFEADKVIITVPLSLLKNKVIEFKPELPKPKLNAIESLGTGLIEKLALRFPRRFWAEKIHGADFFGHIPESEGVRGLFSIFYDMSPEPVKQESGELIREGILMTYISGPALKVVQGLSDEEIKAKCMDVLWKMFPEIEVPPPLNYFVTRWHEDRFAQMSYCYLPVKTSGQVFTTLAQDVEEKVYFAGEATNRHFPQTVTGAYMSGVREADKIIAPYVKEDTGS